MYHGLLGCAPRKVYNSWNRHMHIQGQGNIMIVSQLLAGMQPPYTGLSVNRIPPKCCFFIMSDHSLWKMPFGGMQNFKTLSVSQLWLIYPSCSTRLCIGRSGTILSYDARHEVCSVDWWQVGFVAFIYMRWSGYLGLSTVSVGFIETAKWICFA